LYSRTRAAKQFRFSAGGSVTETRARQRLNTPPDQRARPLPIIGLLLYGPTHDGSPFAGLLPVIAVRDWRHGTALQRYHNHRGTSLGRRQDIALPATRVQRLGNPTSSNDVPQNELWQMTVCPAGAASHPQGEGHW
jgi:hypothetical protein